MPKEQARAIFMARTKMIKVKTNYKNMHSNTLCWGCGQTDETQQHVLEECVTIAYLGTGRVSMHPNPHLSRTT